MANDCKEQFNCCDCGSNECGCNGCWSCNACESCKDYEEYDNNKNCEQLEK